MTNTTGTGTPEQLALLRAQVRPVVTVDPSELAESLPVARVAVDVGLAHLDRPFDYLVPAAMQDTAVPGCRVTVRFSGKQVRGYVLERVAESDHTGRLGRLTSVVSDEVVLRPDVVAAVRSVADRYAGTFSDVVRLAVPPRHARTENKVVPDRDPPAPLPSVQSSVWDGYTGGPDLVRALAAGAAPRACWSALPGRPHEEAIVEAVLATMTSGRGAIVCLPDVESVDALDAALSARLGTGRHVVLTAELGPSARYSAFLAAARGEVPVVIGTRAAAFAPVHDLGLVVIWDDGNDLHAEQRAPYPHAREVLLTRALEADCAVLVGAFARTCEAEQLVETGWCSEVAAEPGARRRAWARVEALGHDQLARDQGARLPREVFRIVREGLAAGPVLVQVPRLGYRTSLACQNCRAAARCARCEGPLQQSATGAPASCRWCGQEAVDWTCMHCGAHRLRAPVVGEQRTAEELGRSFPNTVVHTSSGDSVLGSIRDLPAIVVATPGAEPRAEQGYAAAVLLDTWVMLGRPDLRTEEESLRRWLNAVALVRSATAGGRVAVVADSGLAVIQALVRVDPVGHAVRELDERRATRLPPAVRLATLEGTDEDLSSLDATSWPDPVSLLGPVPVPGQEEGRGARLIVVVPRHAGPALSRRLQEIASERSTRKLPPLRIQVDPVAIG